MQALNRTVVVKWELSRKAELPIYKLILILTLMYGHELWVVTEIIRLSIQIAEN